MTKENTNTNEETMTNKEVYDTISEGLEVGYDLYNKIKVKLVKRGFIMGALAALAIQSLATIAVMILIMT